MNHFSVRTATHLVKYDHIWEERRYPREHSQGTNVFEGQKKKVSRSLAPLQKKIDTIMKYRFTISLVSY